MNIAMVRGCCALFVLLLGTACQDNVVSNFNPKNRMGKWPNLALEAYLEEYPIPFCGTDFSVSDVVNSLSGIEGANNKKAEFYLRMGFCYAMNGDDNDAALYMMRAVNYSNLVKTNGRAKQVAVSYLIYQRDRIRIPFSKNNGVDAAWASQTMRDDGLSYYSYGNTSQELSLMKSKILVGDFIEINSKQKLK